MIRDSLISRQRVLISASLISAGMETGLVGNVRFCCHITKRYLCFPPSLFPALIFHLQVFRPRVFLAPRPIFILTVSAPVFIRRDLGGEPHSSGSPSSLNSDSGVTASLFSAALGHFWLKFARFFFFLLILACGCHYR